MARKLAPSRRGAPLKPRDYGARRGRGAYGDTGGAAKPFAVFALLVLLSLAGGAVYFAYHLNSTRVVLDPETLCPTTGPSAMTVMLLDLTDPLGNAQATRLRALLDQKIAQAPEHAMISLGVVSEDSSEWGQQFARCKPASPETASAIYENPTLIAERFSQEFREPLSEAIDTMMRSEEQDQSPIMEALQDLLAETPHAFDEGRDLRIVIVSDLLQHSDVLSFYRGEGWSEFEASGGAERIAGTLDQAQVEIIKIPRPGAPDAAHAQVDPFWSRYFDRQGAVPPFVTDETLGDL